ncbi:hypothetical protein RD792_004442 [Penstemon davidsonii]|uniref:DYW domain-containing protein n=1 Tax=Penstemon davidsonii TaxID=160366 RepID=A0ABR0DHE4_9LAMI|nr:hypothetical protein RD792_004442 [Penstemon davidsonii]
MTHDGLYAKALDLYHEMRTLGLKPDNYTFPPVIKSCGILMDLDKGRVVHQHIIGTGIANLYVNNALIDMYSRCDELGCARKVFDKMPEKDIVSWNSLISGYSSNGYYKEALEIYYWLRNEGLVPDSFTFSRVSLACGGLGEVEEGRKVHGLVEKIGTRRDLIVNNGLLSMYLKFDDVSNCQRIFDEMVDRDSVTWDIMIFAYCELGLYEESIRLFFEMVGRYETDILTITYVLRACGHVRDLKMGRYVHEYMVNKGYECDTLSSNILINMYAKCGDISSSSKVFENMGNKDLVSWNSLINGYVENKSYNEALELFKRMKINVQPDFLTYVALLSVCKELLNVEFTEELHCDIIKQGFDSDQILGNGLIDAYAKCGKIENSMKQFENMKIRDICTWNSIIAAYARVENSMSFRMLTRMRMEGLIPDIPTLVSVLPVCSNLIAKRQGKELHGCIFKLGFESNIRIGNALIEMYSNTGNLKNSILVFEQMKSRDIISWTSLIASYGMYGEGRQAIKAFEDMKATGIIPDEIIFVAIIYACSHSGLVQEGRVFFEQMKKDYNIEPGLVHYACVVDLLARSGFLVEAEDFILSMPLKPDASIWGVLLSACRANGDLKIAERISERVSEQVIELNTNNPGYLILASNVFAALGRRGQVRTIRTSLKAQGIKKEPGFSWVEVKNRVYYFKASDRFFEQHEEVNELLDDLGRLMAKEGYVADVNSVVHDVEDVDKLNILCGHSERLAIAFGLLHTEPGTPLLVMKNLRVCVDCHTVTKYISKIVKREILVRDGNRFHLFKDGVCSCGDHW